MNSLAGGGVTFAYSYTSNSNLVASISDSTSGWSQNRTYLSNRNLLDVMETKISTTSKAKFDYAQDNLGRFTSVAKTGELYTRYGNGTQGLDTYFGYDDHSQLTSEQTKLGGGSTVLTGRDDAYAFDTIGNRASSSGTTHNSHTANYTTNALNQYTQRTVPGFFDVAGAAGTGTTVTVTKSGGATDTATRHGQYFFDGYAITNTSSPIYTTLAVSDGTTTTNLPAYLAKTAEAFTYDDDGNLLSDGRWLYYYDAENRLYWMRTSDDAWNTGVPQQSFYFVYDYLNRRVLKSSYLWVSGAWVEQTQERFVYNGWNVIAVEDNTTTIVRKHFWGMDLAGPGQTTGGVGALLLTVDGGNSYLPAYDGNGNVMGMINASTGAIDAAYEYDAFGNVLRASGSYAASNTFGFSTKYTDAETSLIYYGMRYYSPSQGRFVTKDPIEEQGGLNLYAFCSNNAINRWDYLGHVWSQADLLYQEMVERWNFDASFNSNSGQSYDSLRESMGMAPNQGASAWANANGSLGTNGDALQQMLNGQGETTGQYNQVSPDRASGLGGDTLTGLLNSPDPTTRVAVGVQTSTESNASFLGELLNRGSSFGLRLTNGLSNLVSGAFNWSLDVFNAGVDQAYNGEISDARWQPLSTLSTTPRPTTLGFLDTQTLVGTANDATFGIPRGVYHLANGNWDAAADSFGGGALTLIGADVAGVRSSNLRVPRVRVVSEFDRFMFAGTLQLWDDGSLFGRLPDPRTAEAPTPPPAIVQTVDRKPAPGAGPPRDNER